MRASVAPPLTSLGPRSGGTSYTRGDVRFIASLQTLYGHNVSEVYRMKASEMRVLKVVNDVRVYVGLSVETTTVGALSWRHLALRGGQPCAIRWTMQTMAVGAPILTTSGKSYSTSCSKVQHQLIINQSSHWLIDRLMY